MSTNSPTPSPSPDNPGRAAPRTALLIVFLVVFIDLLGFGIVLPLMPRYADRLLTPAGVSEQLHGFVIGALMSVFSLMQFAFSPIWGRVSDRVGRKPILILGLAGSVIFYALFGYASSLIRPEGQDTPSEDAQLSLLLMFIARIGAGIAGATIATAQAVIADCTSKEKRAHGMALIGAAFGIGFTFGPLLAGGALYFFPDQPAFAGYAAAILSLTAWTLAIARMPETRQVGVLSPRRGWLDVKGLYSTLQTPTVGVLVLTFFLATFGFAVFEGTLALLNDEMGFKKDQQNFWIFAYVGFVLLLTQGFLYRRLVKKYHEVKLMRLGVAFMFLGLVGLSAVAMAGPSGMRGTAFFVALACGVVGFAFLTPSAQALISKRSDPDRQGEVLGVNQSFSALARILGPFLGVVLFKVKDTHHVLPYLAAAILLAIVMGLLTKVRRD